MALSGNVTTSAYNGRYYKLTWSASQSAANNTSTISWTLSAVGGSGAMAERALSVNINGAEVYSKTAKVSRSAGTVTSGSQTIAHNVDGSKTFSITVKAAVESSTVNCTGSKSFELTIIKRPSTVSCNAASIVIGGIMAIDMQRYNPNYTHKLSYEFYSMSGEIGETDTTGYTWKLPTDFYNAIPSAISGEGTITCTTYEGSSAIGSTTSNFRVHVDTLASKPTLAPSIYDSNSTTVNLTGNSSKLVKGYSNVTYSLSSAANNGAFLVENYIGCGDGKYNFGASGTINKVTSGEFYCRAIDSRDFTTEATVTKTMVDYFDVTCNLEVSAPTTAGSMPLEVTGNFFNASFGSVTNTLTVQYRYKANNGSYTSWKTISSSNITKSGNTYKASVTATGLTYTNRYTVQARAYDKLCTTLSAEKTVKTTPVFDWSETDFNFNVPVTLSSIVNEDADVTLNGYSLKGLINSLTTASTLTATVETGSNYSSTDTANCILVGGSLRCYLYAVRKSAVSGDITNEKVAKLSIKHDGKIKNAYLTSFCNGGTGGAATFIVQNTANDGTYLTFDVYLSATATSTTTFAAYFILPCAIDINKF